VRFMYASNLEFISTRLLELESSRFSAKDHRKIPDSVSKIANLRFFSIPLSSGVGFAVLAEPMNQMLGKVAAKTPFFPENRPLVILLHALGDDCVYPLWHWQEQLLLQGLSVLSLEWDGHGPELSSHLDLQTATRSLPLVLQKIFCEKGHGMLANGIPKMKVFLMGHSMGAALALICASRPEMRSFLSGIVAVSPTVSLQNSSFYRQKERMEFFRPSVWMRDLLGKTPYYGFSSLLSFRKQNHLPLRFKAGADPIGQVNAFVKETFHERRILRSVETPVLWMHGAKDHFVPFSEARPLMLEMPTALFSHVDRERGHVRMAFCQNVPLYAARFISRCALT
jgi:alpha-beta hydrolase superfamily lysophospholipase